MKFPTVLKTINESQPETIPDLSRQVESWAATVSRLRGMESATQTKIDLLTVERSQHLLAALAENNPVAQAERERLQTACDLAGTERKDLTVAIQQAEARLTSLRQELAAAEKQSWFEAVEHLIQQRPEKSEPIQLALRQLLAACQEADRCDTEIDELLVKLDLKQGGVNMIPSMTRLCTYTYMRFEFNRMFGVDHLPSDHFGAHKNNLVEMLRNAFAGWLESLRQARGESRE